MTTSAIPPHGCTPLIPGHGVGSLVLGTPYTVARELGEDFSQWGDWMGGNLNGDVVYRGIVAICNYGPVDQIHVKGLPEVELFGAPIPTLGRADLNALAKERDLWIHWEDDDSAVLSGLWVWFDRLGPDGAAGPEFVIIAHGEES